MPTAGSSSVLTGDQTPFHTLLDAAEDKHEDARQRQRLLSRFLLARDLGADPNAPSALGHYLRHGHYEDEVAPAALLEIVSGLVAAGARDLPDAAGRRPSERAASHAESDPRLRHYAAVAALLESA